MAGEVVVDIMAGVVEADIMAVVAEAVIPPAEDTADAASRN